MIPPHGSAKGASEPRRAPWQVSWMLWGIRRSRAPLRCQGHCDRLIKTKIFPKTNLPQRADKERRSRPASSARKCDRHRKGFERKSHDRHIISPWPCLWYPSPAPDIGPEEEADQKEVAPPRSGFCQSGMFSDLNFYRPCGGILCGKQR